MAELKTKKTTASVTKFIQSIENEEQRKDSAELVKIFESVTKEKACMWGDSIIGFGSYHYKSERSTQEGDWMLTAFSPRKGKISIYIMSGVQNYPEYLKKLGKHQASKGSCLYIKKLEDIDVSILKKMIRESVAYMKKHYPTGS